MEGLSEGEREGWRDRRMGGQKEGGKDGRRNGCVWSGWIGGVSVDGWVDYV